MNTITVETLNQLRAPFPENEISWKAGLKSQDGTLAQAIPYLEGRLVQNVLDRVLGPANWQNEFIEVISNGALLAVRCTISIWVGGQWVGKSDAAPVLLPTNSNAIEMALKGVYTEAMKRAAVHWGIGRYLYAYRPQWVACSDRGKLMEIPPLSAEFLPEGAEVRVVVPNAQRERTPEQMREAPQPDAKPEKVVPVPQAEQEPSAPVEAAKPAVTPAKAPAPQAVEKATAPVAAQPATPVSESPVATELPTDLPADQLALIEELKVKMGKIPLNMIRSYVDGPKGKERLSDAAREYLRGQINAREAAATV